MPIPSRLASEHVTTSYPLTPLSWEVGFTEDPSVSPAEFVPAVVPGAVQLDWARAKKLPDYTFGDNFRQFRFAEDVSWVYRARLALPRQAADEGPTLSFVLPRFGGSTFRLELRVEGRAALDSSYTFAYANVAERRKPAPGERSLNG